mmetsp:Transcript_29977/g.45838  ORF Transcript_29977/g.45838 Transcript_29977/m.45838 type:complete len:88 (-) Transcript_29977:8-271(-)
MHCEKTISLLNHLRIHHKDVSALIKLQRNLAERRKGLSYLKREQPVEYGHVLRIYGLADINTQNGETLKKHFVCKQRRGAPGRKFGF